MKWVVGSVAVLVALVAGVLIGWVARARQDEHLFYEMQHLGSAHPPAPTALVTPPSPSHAAWVEDSAPTPAPTAPLTGDVVAIDPTHYVVREAWAKTHLDDAADLVSGARFLPVVVDGGVAAVRAFGVRRGGTLAQLGIQNGDTIETLNGISLATPDTALEAYAQGSKSKKLVLGIERRGAHMDLHYLVAP